ncbi:MAG: helix-turn-helix transcriptional regulator [Treponema sp.]|nr:helix-turn-helix transcriptional regulator [Treponema sp.]
MSNYGNIDTQIREKVKSRIKDCMKAQKITRIKLAEEMHVSIDCIANYLRSKKPIPPDEALVKMASIFGVDAGYLRGDYDEPHLKTSTLRELTGLSAEACEILRQTKESPALTMFFNHFLAAGEDLIKLVGYSHRFVMSQNSDVIPEKTDLNTDPNYRKLGNYPEVWLYSAENSFRDILKTWYDEIEPEYRLERFYLFAHDLFVVGKTYRDMQKNAHESIKNDQLKALAVNDLTPRYNRLREINVDSVIFSYDPQAFFDPSAELIQSYNREIDHRAVKSVDLNRFKIQE